MIKQELFGMTLQEMQDTLLPLGMKKFRAEQVFRWLYEKAANSFEEMTNLSKNDINILQENFTLITNEIEVLRDLKSNDGLTHKVLLGFPDGTSVETVCMHHDYGYSVCLSSQVGCSMGCTFCASGLHGLERNLTCGEILAQVYYFQRFLAMQEARVSRVVLMGSGEPMLNLDNVLKALDILHEEHGQCIGYRNMTISTCGVIPGIRKMTEMGRTINLAISLHAASDELRTSLMPINKTYNYLEVIKAADEYATENGRQVMYEYILLAGINDSIEDAKILANTMKHKNVVINLIPANPVPEKGFMRPSGNAVDRFFKALKEQKINVTVRKEMGKDIDAACGQLRASTLVGGE